MKTSRHATMQTQQKANRGFAFAWEDDVALYQRHSLRTVDSGLVWWVLTLARTADKCSV